MQYYHLPATRRSPRAVVSVSLINLPLSHDWRDQHVLIILPWFELDQRSIQLHKHSTSERDKHSAVAAAAAAALCIQKAGDGDEARRSRLLFVFPCVRVSPLRSRIVCLAVQKRQTAYCWQVLTCVYLIGHGGARHQKAWGYRVKKKKGGGVGNCFCGFNILTKYEERWMLCF